MRRPRKPSRGSHFSDAWSNSNAETEEVLIARARALHPEQSFPPGYASLFRQTG